MTPSPLSINCKPYSVKDWPGCVSFLKQLDPTAVVVAIDQHDHFNRVLEVQQSLPGAKVIARFIDEIHDGAMHLQPQTTSDKYIVSPKNQLDRIRSYGVNGRIAYFGNEPDTKAPIDDLERLANHTCEAMDLAATRDYDMSLCVLNLGIGHPRPVDGYLPTWMHSILVTLNRHHNRHLLGIHVYLPMDILEFLKALKRTCTERLHIPIPRCVITEFGFDSDGTNDLNGFKSRNITAENFARWCVDTCQDEFRPWLESGDLLGICTFIYGDDASWFNYNVETSTNKGEVSSAWRDTILKAKEAGELDIKPLDTPTLPIGKRDIVLGQSYRLITDNTLVKAYLLPTENDALPAYSIPDNALVTVLDVASSNGSMWLKITYKAFTGVRYIKWDSISLRETVTVPVVIPETDPQTDLKPIPSDLPVGEAISTPKPPETPVVAQKGYVPTTSEIAMLEQWRGQIEFEIKKHQAEIDMYTPRLAFIDQMLSIVKV